MLIPQVDLLVYTSRFNHYNMPLGPFTPAHISRKHILMESYTRLG